MFRRACLAALVLLAISGKLVAADGEQMKVIGGDHQYGWALAGSTLCRIDAQTGEVSEVLPDRVLGIDAAAQFALRTTADGHGVEITDLGSGRPGKSLALDSKPVDCAPIRHRQGRSEFVVAAIARKADGGRGFAYFRIMGGPGELQKVLLAPAGAVDAYWRGSLLATAGKADDAWFALSGGAYESSLQQAGFAVQPGSGAGKYIVAFPMSGKGFAWPAWFGDSRPLQFSADSQWLAMKRSTGAAVEYRKVDLSTGKASTIDYLSPTQEVIAFAESLDTAIVTSSQAPESVQAAAEDTPDVQHLVVVGKGGATTYIGKRSGHDEPPSAIFYANGFWCVSGGKVYQGQRDQNDQAWKVREIVTHAKPR